MVKLLVINHRYRDSMWCGRYYRGLVVIILELPNIISGAPSKQNVFCLKRKQHVGALLNATFSLTDVILITIIARNGINIVVPLFLRNMTFKNMTQRQKKFWGQVLS